MDRMEQAPQGCDVVVVGAGPAGMAAASLCARAGLSTVVVEMAAEPGGRSVGAERWNRDALVAGLAASGAFMGGGTRLAHISPELELTLETGEGERLLHARSVILATGAIERPVPIPPGAMSLGAAYGAFATRGA